MVTKKEDDYKRWPLPIIRIESMELLEILNIISDSGAIEVTAQTDLYKFSSLDDIRNNIELFSGDIEISIGSIRINISDDFMRGVSATLWMKPDEKPQAEALAERFLSRIRFYKAWFTAKRVRPFASMIFAAAFSYFLMAPALLENFPSYSFGFYFAASLGVYYFIANTMLGYLFKDRGPVYYSANDGFWLRNRDKIVVGILMLFVGALMPDLLAFFQK